MLIGMEACAGAHYLARALRDQGHDARLVPAQYVKPYVKTTRTTTWTRKRLRKPCSGRRCVSCRSRTTSRLDLQALHRVRDRWVARRTAVMNQIRGFLLERGMAIRKGPSYLVTQLQVILTEGDSSFSGRLLHLIRELKHEMGRARKEDRGSQKSVLSSPASRRRMMAAIA